jgi:uncharacterized protein YdeI (YjbR/CyaY-like superfamily)
LVADGADWVEVRSRAELRAWLALNHDRGGSAWLVTFKRHHDAYLPFGEAVEELLCWGWVDSAVRAVDADRMRHLISPRDPGSAWSAVNKAKVERARATGAMTEAGEQAIRRAVETGMWAFLDDVERLEVPDDLAAALAAAGTRDAWDGWPKSVRRGTLEWIKSARRAPTRARRISEVVAAAAEGRRPKPFTR